MSATTRASAARLIPGDAPAPKTRYAKSGELSIAYQVFGDGPLDLVVIPGFVSHLEFCWEHPPYERFMRRLASFARVIVYDKRGCGLSDPIERSTTLRSAAPAP